jgi:cysteine-rich repeat protein
MRTQVIVLLSLLAAPFVWAGEECFKIPPEREATAAACMQRLQGTYGGLATPAELAAFLFERVCQQAVVDGAADAERSKVATGWAACGDGFTHRSERCDDGNAVNGDGCDSNCTPTACGNGIVTAGEACDDGNTGDGDGCDSKCETEAR